MMRSGLRMLTRAGESEAEPVDEGLGGGAYARVVVVVTGQVDGLLEQGHLGTRVAARRREEGQRIGLDVQAAAAAAVAGAALGVHGEVSDLECEA